MIWLNFLWAFLAIVIVRLLINIQKFLQVTQLAEEYNEYLRKDGQTSFPQKTRKAVSLFKEADLGDAAIHRLEPAGYGKLLPINASVFENLGLRTTDVVPHVLTRFAEAEGVYRQRIRDCLNPIYWLEVLTKLPEYLLKYVGVLPEKIIVKIFNILYWVLLAIFTGYKLNLMEFLHPK